mgnify:CR=1 FL=1
MSKIYPSEKGFKIELTITDTDGVAIDITGATVSLEIYQSDGKKITKTATLDNPTSGICSYTTTDISDFTVPGEYKIQPKVTLSSGSIFYGTTQIITINEYGT